MPELTIEQAFALALEHHQAGKLDEAEAIYRQILAGYPDNSDAWHLLGIILSQKGEYAQALNFFNSAIAISPSAAIYHNNRGFTLLRQGSIDQAVESFRTALRIRPDYADAYFNLGVALQKLHYLDEAAAASRKAIELKPDDAPAFNNLGNIYRDQGRFDRAVTAYRRAIEIRPAYFEAHSNLVYSLNFDPVQTPRSISEELTRWRDCHAQSLSRLIQPHTNDRDPGRRLKIGYVSGDFCRHASVCFLISLLSSHDHRTFEIFCYSNSIRTDDITERLHYYADVWRDVRNTPDPQIAQIIQKDRIDILVDLSVHSAQHRLLVFAAKPAPIQVTWLGYPGSTGLKTIDYRLTDPYLDPPGLDDEFYSEASVRLPDCFWCYDPLISEPVSEAIPAQTNGYVTFGCLNNFCKVNKGVLSLWARVLHSVPDSHLLLLAPEGQVRQEALTQLNQDGISKERVTLIRKLARADYFKLFNRIDLSLDPFPYNGHTTTFDSLWMGVPVLSLSGQTVVGRAG
ncbi:MAG TPA: tetratricopeptide repeat protein, partial [Phycisphaerae bacterium]|nr:tetratricopeptide repeat protein [Phycisphaerae bacterium]